MKYVFNIPKYIALFFIKAYQLFISPLLPPVCRFTPTCSEYAVKAFSRYGFFFGFYLTIRRIIKCQPFYKGCLHDDIPPIE